MKPMAEAIGNPNPLLNDPNGICAASMKPMAEAIGNAELDVGRVYDCAASMKPMAEAIGNGVSFEVVVAVAYDASMKPMAEAIGNGVR